MAKIFALLGIVLILSGIVLLAVPGEQVAPGLSTQQRSAAPGVGVQVKQPASLIAQVRSIAEQANAPLSILFGLMSLYHTRRTYLKTHGGPG